MSANCARPLPASPLGSLRLTAFPDDFISTPRCNSGEAAADEDLQQHPAGLFQRACQSKQFDLLNGQLKNIREQMSGFVQELSEARKLFQKQATWMVANDLRFAELKRQQQKLDSRCEDPGHQVVFQKEFQQMVHAVKKLKLDLKDEIELRAISEKDNGTQLEAMVAEISGKCGQADMEKELRTLQNAVYESAAAQRDAVRAVDFVTEQLETLREVTANVAIEHKTENASTMTSVTDMRQPAHMLNIRDSADCPEICAVPCAPVGRFDTATEPCDEIALNQTHTRNTAASKAVQLGGGSEPWSSPRSDDSTTGSMLSLAQLSPCSRLAKALRQTLSLSRLPCAPREQQIVELFRRVVEVDPDIFPRTEVALLSMQIELNQALNRLAAVPSHKPIPPPLCAEPARF